MPCPMFKWYEGERGGESELPINSVIEGSLIIPKKGNARIVTRELERYGKDFECALDSNVRKIFGRAGVDQDYGLIIFLPGEYGKLSESKVVDFISFHRHPSRYTKKPTSSRFGITDYTEVFDALALKELGDKEAQLSKARSRIVAGNLPPLVEAGA